VSPDVVIVGAGLSGLVDAILLAESGRTVRVLEQHKIPGGYLQQFQRKGTVFDVGFHYLGSTLPGRPMRQMMEHLRIWDRVTMLPFPEDAAIEVRHGALRFAFPSRFERFHEKAVATWPHARGAIDRFVGDVGALCAQFKWFALKKGVAYGHPLDLDLPPCSFDEYLRGLTDDPDVRDALSFQSFNLGLYGHEIPWVKYALAFRSNFDLTSRIDGGGGALVAALVARGEELGVEYRFRTDVAALDCEGRAVRAVVTADGERHEAELFVAACHPKPILRMIPDESVRPMYKDRVLRLKDSRGALQVFVRLKEPLDSLDATCLMIRDDAEAAASPPVDTLLVTYPSAVETVDRGGPRLEAMSYVHQSAFARWRDLPVMRRGEEYERLKDALARRVIAVIARVAPELPGRIADVYTATPLSDEWYTRNEAGGVFGISHDVGQQGTNRPMPRLRLKNLFFTGHSITMAGICGTFINAFDTCDQIRGDGVLFEALSR